MTAESERAAQPSLDDQMRLAVRAMAHHAGESSRIDRTGWTDEQWIEDAERLMNDLHGSVSSLVNGHVMALLTFWRKQTANLPASGHDTALTEDEREAIDLAVIDDHDRARGYRVMGPGGTDGQTPTVYEVVQRILAARSAAPADETLRARFGADQIIDAITDTFLANLPSAAMALCAQEDVNAGLDAMRERFRTPEWQAGEER